MHTYKIAVITPYYQEPLEILSDCHQSVIGQKVNADIVHFLIADGFPMNEVNIWDVRHVVLPKSNNDNGNTPRCIGSILADADGYDFIAYLDADNWYHESHLQSLLDQWLLTKSHIIASFRTFHAPDKSLLNFTETLENELKHVDTSCYLLHKSCFDLIYTWTKMPKNLSPICDRIFLAAIIHKHYRVSFTQKRTVAFRSQYELHYINNRDSMPEKIKPDSIHDAWRSYIRSNLGIKACVDRLGFWPLPYLF